MKITDIKAQVKNKDRFSVYVDGKYSFSLSAWQISGSGIKLGREIDDSVLAELKSKSDFGKLFDRTLRWAYMRRRSEREIDQYLKKITENANEWEPIKEKLSDLKLIDDEEFARVWVRSRRRAKLASARKLTGELRMKGVSQEVITQVIAEDESSDSDTLSKLIEKKRRMTRYQDDKKLMQYLIRQGYSYGEVKDALAD